MKNAVGVLVCVLLLAAAGCSRKEAPGPPVATPSVTLSRAEAAIGSPLRVTYRFQVAQDPKIDGDYSVFVHVREPGGETLWQDDHEPSIPTSQWKPGQVVEYTRTIFVPNYPYIGDAEILLGMYSPTTGKRLTLAGQEAGPQEYRVADLDLLPQSENIFLILDVDKGWHAAEVDPANPSIEWQWTRKVATLAFRNPKRDATLYLESDARVDLFNPPQQVTLRAGAETIGTFAADSRDKTLRTFPIAAAQLGTGDMAEITLEVDRTFTAGGADTRELGIRVFHLFIEPR